MDAVIRVYAALPTVTINGPPTWDWVHCLTLPIEQLRALQFSVKPFKWIRYSIGVVIGAQGVLSSSRQLTIPVDYDSALPSDSIEIYYHVNNEERDTMFPIDPNFGCTRVTSSVGSSRRGNFRDEVVERDAVCILAGTLESYCEAAHLVSHSKGDMVRHSYFQSVIPLIIPFH